ncbi:TonB-dependent receptor domain-containing protein [Brucella haematophila]|uniref:TonB-dependent receptor domain-containing protein n=1 Tax=Brucella haematophila TaxID=419474 RepID=UPI00110F16FB|nr:TonB-dependent receptor [Brucella haematophila]KAB2700378.1 TonB-dependent receptor [Ochrobactrum sp. Kaboul]TMV06210.1 TonB-dependent receptor [Brucella haematophila]
MRATGGVHKRSFLASSGLAVILVAMASQSLAQEQKAAESESDVKLKTITIKGDGAKGDTTYNTPAAVSTVSSEELRRNGDVKLDDVLRDKPGVFTRTNGSQPGVAVNIRGFEGSGRVNMMVDGVRQNFRFTGHEAQGFTYVDPNLLADIDISRGAVTGAGGGALAGSVNFRTLGVDDIVRQGQQYGVLGRASWGSNGVGFSEMLAAGARVNSMGVAAAISRRDSKNYKDGDGVEQPDTGQELTSGLVKTEFGFGEDHKLSLGGVFYNNDFGANSYDQNVKNKTFTANYSYNPSDNDLIDLHVNAYYNRLDMTYYNSLSTGLPGSATGRSITDKGYGFDISNTSRFNVGEVGVKWNYGVEYFRDDISGDNSGVNPVDGRSSNGAVFSETTFSYGIVDLIAGLRYDFFKTSGSADTGLAGFGENGVYDVDISKQRLDPKITLAINATDWLQPYITYSQSMRSPTLQETMLGGNHPGSTSVSFLPNPTLSPETQKGWEIGVNVKKDDLFLAGDSLRLKADYYDMDVEDYITSTFNPTYRKYQFVNVDGTSQVRGFELEAMYDAGMAFGGITYTHSKSDLPAQTPGLGAGQYMPDDVFSVSGGARFLERKLTVGGRYSYVSGGDTVGYAGVTQSDSYGLVDVFANYKFTDNVDLTLKVNNLFDKSYTPFLSTSGSGQGRTFLVATQFQF